MESEEEVSGEIKKDSTRSFVSQDSTKMRNYSGMLGRVSLAELKEFLAERAPGIPDEEVMVNWSTVTWEDEATPEELEKREERRRYQEQRKEEWELKMLAQLLEKHPQGKK